MKNKLIISSLLLSLSVASVAKDSLVTFDFNAALQKGYAEGILDKNITFKLKGQPHKSIKKVFSDYKSNKKTRGAGRSNEDSCAWAMLSALKAFQDRAHSLGANAVVDIVSNYKNHEFISSKEYQCGAGFLMSGVALKAKVVNL